MDSNKNKTAAPKKERLSKSDIKMETIRCLCNFVKRATEQHATAKEVEALPMVALVLWCYLNEPVNNYSSMD